MIFSEIVANHYHYFEPLSLFGTKSDTDFAAVAPFDEPLFPILAIINRETRQRGRRRARAAIILVYTSTRVQRNFDLSLVKKYKFNQFFLPKRHGT